MTWLYKRSCTGVTAVLAVVEDVEVRVLIVGAAAVMMSACY